MKECYLILLEGGGYIFPCGVFGDVTNAQVHAKVYAGLMTCKAHTLAVVKVPFDRSLEIGLCDIPTGYEDILRYSWDAGDDRLKLEVF